MGSKTLCCFITSAKIGTVELTGFEITQTIALGAYLVLVSHLILLNGYLAVAIARFLMIPALMLKRSSLVMPCNT